MKFMLILRDNPAMFADKAPAEMPGVIQEYVDWAQKMRTDGRLLGAEKLNVDEPGRVLRPDGDRVEMRHGAASETGEIIGGTMTIDAKDYAEACRLAESNPQLRHGGAIEVRQIDEV